MRRLPLLWHRLATRILGIRVHVHGAPADARPLLLVANHVSWLDITVLGSVMELSFISKSEVASWPVFGLFAKLQRSVFVDREKRAKTGEVAGEIATRLADVTIVTDDNPRSEVPETIRAAIMAAAPGAIEIGDRREAIHTAIDLLKAGDTLIVAGKGHEEGQTIGNETLPFSDHEEVRVALRGRAA